MNQNNKTPESVWSALASTLLLITLFTLSLLIGEKILTFLK